MAPVANDVKSQLPKFTSSETPINLTSPHHIMFVTSSLADSRPTLTDEAGFEVLAGTSDTSTNSAQYTERAFVLSRGFVQALFDKRPGGLDDIAQWTYLSQHGPKLLQTIIQEAKALLPADPSKTDTDTNDAMVGPLGHGNGSKKLSRGAAMLLERTVRWLEGFAARL